MSLKRKSSSESFLEQGLEPELKRQAVAALPFLNTQRTLPSSMDPSYFAGYRADEDFMSGDMFTSQAQEFHNLPVTASTAMSMDSMTAFDTLSMDSGLGWNEPTDQFVPALTPSRDSDFSSPSSENVPWLEQPNQAQEALNFDISQAIFQQVPAAYPMKSQWPNVSMDSPLSVPSNYDDHESQVSLLDVGQSAFEMAAFDASGCVAPNAMVNSVIMDQPYPSMEQLATHRPMDHNIRRMSNESGPREARSDPRYKQRPGPDGLYHCPFPDCDHEADKLKCNYDKHLDAHLRPYRCTREACRSIQFSSTACVLRHEREAHGMHGHGHKPYICKFQDCERASPENGFPRKWNLKDHMKRVHHYDEEAAAKSAASPMTPPESPGMHVAGPQRVKRGSRASPKPRTSKDDTIKASSTRRPTRMPVPQSWVPDMHQDMKYEPAWDADGLTTYLPQQWM